MNLDLIENPIQEKNLHFARAVVMTVSQIIWFQPCTSLQSTPMKWQKFQGLVVHQKHQLIF